MIHIRVPGEPGNEARRTSKCEQNTVTCIMQRRKVEKLLATEQKEEHKVLVNLFVNSFSKQIL